MAYTVWMKDAIDDDRFVISNLNHAQADGLVRTLSNIVPGTPVWMEQE